MDIICGGTQMNERKYIIKDGHGNLVKVMRERRRCIKCRKNFTFMEMLSRDIKDRCFLCLSFSQEEVHK